MVVEQKPYQWLSWIATVCLLGAALLAAFNIYPLYIWAFIVSNSLWILVGVLWKEKKFNSDERRINRNLCCRNFILIYNYNANSNSWASRWLSWPQATRRNECHT